MSAGAGGAGTAPGSALTERLTAFVRALRGHGIRIGPGETVDAAAVLEVLGLADRERIREGLAAALLRADRQRAVFDAAFELYFPLGVGELTGARDASAGDRDELRDRLAEALAANDTAALGRLAGEAVDLLGRYGSPVRTAGRPIRRWTGSGRRRCWHGSWRRRRGHRGRAGRVGRVARPARGPVAGSVWDSAAGSPSAREGVWARDPVPPPAPVSGRVGSPIGWTPMRSGVVSRTSGTGCVRRRGGGSPSAGERR